MLYLRPTFTCPAAPNRTSQQKWDFAILSKDEYMATYNISAKQYAKLSQ